MINFSNFFITPPKTFQLSLGVAGKTNTDFVRFVTILPIFAAKRPDYNRVSLSFLMFVSAETEEDESADDSNNSNPSNTPGGKAPQSTSSQLEQIIQRLPTCVNRDFIDEVSLLYV